MPGAQAISPSRCLAAALAVVGLAVCAPSRAAEPAPPPGAAAAPSKRECADAFEQAQRSRQEFKYVEATAQALQCAAASCGAALSEECSNLYAELQTATPSIVLGARNEQGDDLSRVSVSIDGGSPRLLDGTPWTVDPGNHELIFTADGFEPHRQTTVIRAGERLRPIVGVLTPKSSAAPPPATSLAKEASPHRDVPLASYVLGGVTVVGFAGFAGFRVAGANKYDSLSRGCKPTCSHDSVDAARRLYLVSYAGLAIGAAASIAAVTLYLTTPNQAMPQAALQVEGLPSGMGARLTTTF